MNILAVCTYCLQRFIEINDRAGLILTVGEANEASEVMDNHLRTYAVLASHFWNKREMLFKMRSKTHYLWHVARETRVWRLNTGLFHTFQDESFLGKIKCIGVRCHGRTCSQRLFQRLILCLAVFMNERRKASC